MKIIAWTVVLLLTTAIAALGAFPPPGHHSVAPKYWPGPKLHVVNYSPYDYSSPVDAMIADRHGDGIWYAIGSSIEHLDRNGNMHVVWTSDEWLWRIYGMTYDAQGRLWFSLGQSGRIAMLDARGRVHIEHLVARYHFPDIRDIAFDSRGSLWFVDVGRRSIGRRLEDGTVREVPIEASIAKASAWPYVLAMCAGKPYIGAGDSTQSFVLTSSPDLSTLSVIKAGGSTLWSSPVCDAEGRLWMVSANYTQVARIATRERDGRTRAWRSGLFGPQVVADPRRGVWLSTSRVARATYGSPVVEHMLPDGTLRQRWTLPTGSLSFGPTLATAPAFWIATSFPQSIVELRP